MEKPWSPQAPSKTRTSGSTRSARRSTRWMLLAGTAWDGNGGEKARDDEKNHAIVEVADDLRHSLRLSGSRGKLLIPLERRDVRVVEGARLESDSGDSHAVILKHLFTQSIQRLPTTECVSR